MPWREALTVILGLRHHEASATALIALPALNGLAAGRLELPKSKTRMRVVDMAQVLAFATLDGYVVSGVATVRAPRPSSGRPGTGRRSHAFAIRFRLGGAYFSVQPHRRSRR